MKSNALVHSRVAPSADGGAAVSDPPSGPRREEGLVEAMLGHGREALLLRPQVVGNLSRQQRRTAAAQLDNLMGLVPEGNVLMPCGSHDGEQRANQPVLVEAFFLDRYAVTNRQFKQFVDDGGYEQIAFWEPEILSGMLDFVDLSGKPGPRLWHSGGYPPDADEHPVVGVSWYEAHAYARWVGKRLPTDAEWVKAASWPVDSGAGMIVQRGYPWGDSMDRTFANIWGSGPGAVVAVDDFESGMSVNGLYQLVGNVWEWMSSDMGTWDHTTRLLTLDNSMKAIRGGAFDTYFDAQASCSFQSGEALLSRKPNIGFRCAVGLPDVVWGELLDIGAGHQGD